MAIFTCAMCGEALPAAGTGRPRSFCSAPCKQRAYRQRAGSGVPVELRSADRWVTWAPNKCPMQLSGIPASSTNPATWTSYAKVRSASRKGFVLNGDGIVCIDLDHCLEDGEPTREAAALLAVLPRTYVEVSPSGDGLHVWGHGSVCAGRKIRRDGLAIEVYGTGRYLTVTGQQFAGSTSRLADLSGVLVHILS